MWPNPQFPGDLITFTEEILNGKLDFSCSDSFVEMVFASLIRLGIKAKLSSFSTTGYTLFLQATPDWNCQEIKQILSKTLRLNICYLKIIHILHTRYHRKIIGYIFKKQAKEKVRVYSWDYTVNLLKMKMKMKKDHIE